MSTKKDSKVNKSSSTKDAANGRGGQRIPIQLLVDYKSDGHYLFDFCRDLGSGGVFIETDNPLEMNAEVSLTFTIPDSKETLEAKGVVIWVQQAVTPGNGAEASQSPGMGVQFNSFDSDQRHILESFLERYHGKGYHPVDVSDDSA